MNQKEPELHATAYTCPNCGAYAKQTWFFLRGSLRASASDGTYANNRFMIGNCSHCDEPSLWKNQELIHPVSKIGEPPNDDLPSDVRDDFEEARAIGMRSPRGAAALLRLGLQKLCKHLGESGNNINADIAALVGKGLPPTVQQALDTVRVVGNEAVHPGTLDMKDDLTTTRALFKLLNFVCQKMISEPKEIAQIYNTLPAEKLAGIQQRDSGS